MVWLRAAEQKSAKRQNLSVEREEHRMFHMCRAERGELSILSSFPLSGIHTASSCSVPTAVLRISHSAGDGHSYKVKIFLPGCSLGAFP